MNLFSRTFSILENGLNYSSAKQKVIAQNISNADTPNYKAKTVSFRSELNAAMDKNIQAVKTDERHFDFRPNPPSNVQVVTKKDSSYHSNGNNVDIDKEMSDLAANQIYYNALAERISGKFRTLQSVIKGGNA